MKLENIWYVSGGGCWIDNLTNYCKSWQDAGFNMTIDTTTNIATITVEHFSLFSLGLKQGATSNGGGPTISGYPIWSFMIFAAISTVIVIRKRNLKVHKSISYKRPNHNDLSLFFISFSETYTSILFSNFLRITKITRHKASLICQIAKPWLD